MKQMNKSILAMVLMAAAGHVMADESIDLKVIGTITPSACSPSLTGGGTVDYGSIPAGTLSSTDYTILAGKQLDISITCDAPTKVGFQVINGRPGSAASDDAEEGANSIATAPTGMTLYGWGSAPVAGLGLSGTAKVGGYTIMLSTPTILVDGKSNAFISTKNTAAWDMDTGAASYSLFTRDGSLSYFTVANSGTNTPLAFTTMSARIGIEAYINKKSELDLTKEIKLDGLATIKLVYL